MNQMLQHPLDRSPSTYRWEIMTNTSNRAGHLHVFARLNKLIHEAFRHQSIIRSDASLCTIVRTSGRKYLRDHVYLPRICNFAPYQSPSSQVQVATWVYDRRRLPAELHGGGQLV